jgi:hypothetical protein
MLGPASFQHAHQTPQYGYQNHDPTQFAMTQQQQQYHRPHCFVPQVAKYQPGYHPPPPQVQTHLQLAPMDLYAYERNQPSHSHVDLNLPLQHFPMAYALGQSSSGPVAVPSFPRGPPRKPKRSGHALWVGNLPSTATVLSLKDHFSRDATLEIRSLFWISRSNCAFVNYQSESACAAAMERFHNSGFHGFRLVCRPSGASTGKLDSSTIAGSPWPAFNSDSAPKGLDYGIVTGRLPDQIIVDSAPAVPGTTGTEGPPSRPAITKVSEMFFIMKSLTLQDLEASVQNGIWATQSHNEPRLNEAFDNADKVYLVFSANKSGAYFGYARMVSSIAGGAVSDGSVPSFQPLTSSGGPRSTPTPATETAPRGRVVDDSARGTIFWEAELSGEESASLNKGLEGGSGGQDLGRTFRIEWISTAQLPFYRTRGLRNPWNSNKEVKIARDGTALEPSIGRRLVQMFHWDTQIAALPHQMQSGDRSYLMA